MRAARAGIARCRERLIAPGRHRGSAGSGAFAPGTGTPEIGGLTSRELLRILRGLGGLDLAGADVVEVAPAYDHAEATALAAATVIFDMITLLAKARKAG